jgi:hypothetical protein
MGMLLDDTMTQDIEWEALQQLMGADFNNTVLMGMNENHGNNGNANLDTAAFHLLNNDTASNDNQLAFTPPTLSIPTPGLLAIAAQDNHINNGSPNLPKRTRHRKPAGPKEVVPLTGKDISEMPSNKNKNKRKGGTEGAGAGKGKKRKLAKS